MAFITYDECIALRIHLRYRIAGRCAICATHSPLAAIRYVIARKGANDPMRTLAEPAQGRYTYTTAEEAGARLREIRETANGDAKIIEDYYPNAQARPVECWPGDFDPKTYWFDEPAT